MNVLWWVGRARRASTRRMRQRRGASATVPLLWRIARCLERKSCTWSERRLEAILGVPVDRVDAAPRTEERGKK